MKKNFYKNIFFKLITLLLIISFNKISFSQNFKIAGNIVDSKNEPIAFANIFLKNIINNKDTTSIITGTSSDLMGDFILNIPNKKKYVLFVSSIGYKIFKQKIDSSNIKPLKICLKEKINVIKGVSIVGKSVQKDIDKTEYYITSSNRKKSLTSLSLVNTIPTLKVDETKNKITTIQGKSVKILMNGRNSDEIELMTTNPKQIVKIEYYDIPPTRFANSGYNEVINIITKEAIRGGNVFCSIQNATNTGYGNNIVSLKYNKKKSQLGLYYYYSYRSYKEKTYDSYLNYRTENNNFHEKKILGYHYPFGYNMHIINLNFSNKQDKNYLFNVNIISNIVSSFDKPNYNISRKDNNIIYSGIGEKKYNSDEFKPSIDLYYQKELPKNSEFMVNIVGSSFDINSDYILNELSQNQSNDTLLSDFSNDKSDKTSLISEILYTKNINKYKINIGMKYDIGRLNQKIDNTFGEGHYTLKTSNKYIYTSLIAKYKKISFKADLGLISNSFKEKSLSNKYNYNSFVPSINIAVPLTENSNLDIFYKKSSRNPSLSQLNNHKIYDDNYIIYSGNPKLKPYDVQYSSIKYTYYHKKISSGIQLQYSYTLNPLLTDYKQYENYLLRSYNNEDFKQEIVFSTYFSFKLLKNNLNLTLYGATYKFTNKYNNGNKIKLQSYFYSLSLEYNYNHFIIKGNVANPLKKIENQQKITLPSESDISIHYKLKHLTMGVGMYLPFAESYKTTTIINESYIINNYTTQIYDNGRMLYLRLSYNFAFDKQLNWNKKLSNEDNDTGVLKD